MQQLAKHISKNEHTATTSLVISNPSRVMKDGSTFDGCETLSDVIANMCFAESTIYSRVVGIGASLPVLPTIAKTFEFPILDNQYETNKKVIIQDRLPGYAMKQSGKRFPLTSKMLTFVLFCFNQGTFTCIYVYYYYYYNYYYYKYYY